MRVILVDTREDKAQLALLENGKLIEVIHVDRDHLVGNIYVGQVKSVSQNFIFVDIGIHKNGFLHKQEGIKPNDFIQVRVKKNGINEKGPLLTFIGKAETAEISNIYQEDQIQKIIDSEKPDQIIRSDDEDRDIFSDYEIGYKLPKGNKVWLKSGGYLTIEKTAACTVIDVNTGKSTSKKHDVHHLTNIEAAEEIAYQLRLRQIAGIVIVDFINSKDQAQTKALLAILKEKTKSDRADVQVLGMTKLGLAEITRQRI